MNSLIYMPSVVGVMVLKDQKPSPVYTADLSREYTKNVEGIKTPDQCAAELFNVIQKLDESSSGMFLDYNGNQLPF